MQDLLTGAKVLRVGESEGGNGQLQLHGNVVCAEKRQRAYVEKGGRGRKEQVACVRACVKTCCSMLANFIQFQVALQTPRDRV